MMVDLLTATFWPEALASRSLEPQGAEPAPAEDARRETVERAARTEGFWAAVARRLWRPAARPAVP